MAIILKNAPKTEESRWLNFSEEEEERYRIVFRYDEKTKELVNVEPWNAEEKYNNYCVIVPFSSSFDGKKDFGPMDDLQNVIGSTYDPKPDGYRSWIKYIEDTYKRLGLSDDVVLAPFIKPAFLLYLHHVLMSTSKEDADSSYLIVGYLAFQSSCIETVLNSLCAIRHTIRELYQFSVQMRPCRICILLFLVMINTLLTP